MFPGTHIPYVKVRSNKSPNVVDSSQPQTPTHHVEEEEIYETRWVQVFNVGLIAGWQKQQRRVVIKREWDTKPGSDDKENLKTERLEGDWYNKDHQYTHTEVVTFGWADAGSVESWQIKPPAGFSIGVTIPIETRLPPVGPQSELPSDVTKIEDPNQIQQIEKDLLTTQVYDKFTTYAKSKSNEPDAIYLGFKKYLIGSKIDPLTVKSHKLQYEGELVQEAMRTGKSLVITDIKLVEEKSARDVDGVTITYATYLIMLGLINGN